MNAAPAKSLADKAAEYGLKPDEYDLIVRRLNREPNDVELGVFSVMWSEHCSYKSSRKHLGKFPTKGPKVIFTYWNSIGGLGTGEAMIAGNDWKFSGTIHVGLSRSRNRNDPHGTAERYCRGAPLHRHIDVVDRKFFILQHLATALRTCGQDNASQKVSNDARACLVIKIGDGRVDLDHRRIAH